MKRANQVASIVLFLFSIALMIESRKLVFTAEFGRPGAGFFPFWLGVLLAILSFQLFLQNRPTEAERDEASPFADLRRLGKPALILASLFVFALTLPFLGFLVAIGLFLAFLLVPVEKHRWLPGLITAVVGGFAFYLIFEVWLDVPLPIGVLGI